MPCSYLMRADLMFNSGCTQPLSHPPEQLVLLLTQCLSNRLTDAHYSSVCALLGVVVSPFREFILFSLRWFMRIVNEFKIII